ncbi:hypothetical protein D3C77_269590 [compost metagenome]
MACFVCGEDPVQVWGRDAGGKCADCPRCGRYDISQASLDKLKRWKLDGSMTLLWMKGERERGADPVLIETHTAFWRL